MEKAKESAKIIKPVKQEVVLDDLTPEQLEKSLKAKEHRETINKPVQRNKVINVEYTCLACRIKRFQDVGKEKHPCPDCRKEMTPLLTGNVKIEGVVQYDRNYDKRS